MLTAVFKRLCLFMGSLIPIGGLTQFTEYSGIFGIEAMSTGALHGNGCSMMDYNGDGKDDLSIAQKGSGIQFFKNENGALVQDFLTFIPAIDPTVDGKSPLWLDYDNDGDKDFFYTQMWDGAQLYRNDNGIFTEVTAEAGILVTYSRAFGAAAGDYNKDGFLDIYVCKFHNYLSDFGTNYSNQLFRNNGDGTFTDVTDESGLGFTVQASFTALFSDFNRDTWPDIYVVNDKIVQGNYLYINNGDGTFTNQSEESGAGVHMYAMTGSVDDYDNDNDLDIFVSNEHTEHALLNNDGNAVFTNVVESAGLFAYDYSTEGWAGLWIDYDNNQWQDLFVCTYGTSFGDPYRYNDFFINQGDGTFVDGTAIAGLLNEPNLSFTTCMGDINSDGYYDFFVSNAFPTNSEFWMNQGGENHFLSVELEGTISNRDGVGAYIDIWAGGEQFTRYTHCGENYMGQNSRKEIFGLGSLNYVDSLRITWQSGIVETYERIPTDQHLYLVEGVTHDLWINASSLNLNCPGDSVFITAGTWASYFWSNSDTSAVLATSEPDTYSLRAADQWGNLFESQTVTVTSTLINYPSPISDIHIPQCHGGSDAQIALNADLYDELYVGDLYMGNTADTLNGLSAGDYLLSYLDPSGCPSEILVTIDEAIFYEEPVITSYSPACFGNADGSIDISIPGGNDGWMMGLPEENGNLASGSYDVYLTAPNGCQTSYEVILTEPEVLSAIIEVDQPLCYDSAFATIHVWPSGGVPDYTISTTYETNVSPPGFYEVFVTDNNGCLFTDTVEVIAPTQLTASVYHNPDVQDDDPLTGNGQAGLIIEGGIEPYSIIWSNGEMDISTIDSLIAGDYSCLVTDANGCSVTVEFSIESALYVYEESRLIQAFPNPSSDKIFISSGFNGLVSAELYGASGIKIRSWADLPSSFEVEIADLPSGLYRLILYGDHQSASISIIRE